MLEMVNFTSNHMKRRTLRSITYQNTCQQFLTLHTSLYPEWLHFYAINRGKLQNECKKEKVQLLHNYYYSYWFEKLLYIYKVMDARWCLLSIKEARSLWF